MRPHRYAFVAGCLAAALSACSPSAPPSAGPAESGAAVAGSVPPAVTDEAGLRQAAAAALSEQRIYAPAGDNAIEHYLGLRALRPDDATLATALLELLPYALIASEQAVAREDFPEARRLLGLIERVDPQAPSLSRLRDSIVAAESESARRVIAQAEEAKRLEQAAAMADAAATEARRARDAGIPAATPGPAPASMPAAPVATSAPSPTPPPPPAPAPTSASAPVTTAPSAATPRLLSAPPPRYPLVALRRKIEGSVTVAFVIQPDGSVGSPRVVSADPPGVFEEAALVAAGRWRFEPTAAAVSTARVVQFRLGEAAP